MVLNKEGCETKTRYDFDSRSLSADYILPEKMGMSAK